MKLSDNGFFTLLVLLAAAFSIVDCGGDSFEAAPSVPADAQSEVLEAGPDNQVEASPEAEAGKDVVTENVQPEAQPEAGEDVVVDAPEEPLTGICATQGHDGKIMVHPMVTLGPTAYLTVYGMLTYPGDAGAANVPFDGWCWSTQGGQGEFDCFPQSQGVEAPATSGAKVLFQIGTTNGPSGPPSYYLCDFGVCPVEVVVCAGKTEACRWTNGTATGDIVYKEPGHNGKGELVCTLP